MRKLLLIATLAALFYIAVFAQQVAGEGGCCCEPILHNGSLVEARAECDESYFNFTDQITLGQTCDEACNAFFQGGIIAPPILNCKSPLYRPPPGNLQIMPVKGKKQLRLTFTLPCPQQTMSLNISRCAGDDCDDFANIAKIAPTTVFVDNDASLLWNQVYTYKVESNSRFSGRSEPAIGSKNPGDIECWEQGYDKFCISPFYYDRFSKYLSENGYYDTTADIFSNNFEAAVDATFSGKFNKGSFCSAENLLGQGNACPEGKQCVADGEIYCVSPTDCDKGGVFGLYPTLQTCEGGIAPNNKYCFLDRSHSSVDECFACNPQMGCADYRTKGSCERDNCYAGNCSWHPVFNDIGIGVCIDERFPNCLWCKTPGTAVMENLDAYNEVFDQCTAKKSSALTVGNYTCVYDKNSQQSNACDAAACMDYSDKECGTPMGGIMLNPDNSLESFSTDICKIKVCQNMSGTGCTKNHDGNSVPDCPPLADDRRKCELDYFPPNTTMIPIMHEPAYMDWLDIQMLDKFNATHEGALMEGQPGYRTMVCVVSEEDTCSDASTFAETNVSMLNFNDQYLQGGRDVLALMEAGENTLMYYGIDSRNNPEIVRNMTILACTLCQGPKVLEVSVTPSRYYEGKFYTIADIPVIKVTFNEPATLAFAALTVGGKVMPVSSNPAGGANYEYTFIPMNPLPDNEYTLTFNAKDSNGKLMDPPGGRAVIVIDTTPGNVQIIPPDGTVINDTSVDISFIFTEPLTIMNVTFEDEIWISKYAAKKVSMNLKPFLTPSEDGLTYSTRLDQLSGGKKNLKVHAEDFSGNPTIGKSSFWINQGSLQMRLREPTWGVSASYVFDIVVETSIASNCKYAYGLPAPFPITAFDVALLPFPVQTEVTHTIPDFNKIAVGDLKPHKLHVYCKSGENIVLESFDLRVDPTPPVIKSAYAQPEVIIETRIPGVELYSTYLKVQTDDEGFCKYSTDNVPFVLMNGLFSGFDEVPKRSHDAEINVTQDNTSYTYYVACKNTAEMPSATVPVKFSVDTSVPFSATSMTPPYSNSTEFYLRIETNKRAFCYVGEDPEAVITLMGESGAEFGYAHPHPVSVNSSGNYTWFVKCSTGAGSEVSDLVINVVVDTTPPEMLYVNDSSTLVEEPEFSYFPDQLQVSFLGTDAETSVMVYYYRLMTFHSNDTVRNWTMSTNLNGTAFYVTGLNLTDGNKYRFEAYPVNIVGVQGDSMESDGVTIDFEKAPISCENGALDADEADVDCGGQCAGCLDGAKCNASTDCISGFCNNGVCSIVSCDDGAKNGNETDVDCGGGVCLPCGMDKTCVVNSDCATGSCNSGMCGNPDPCADGVLSGTETDVDCGGSCSNKCGDGKNCQLTPDCAAGLMCIESTCQGTRDSDADGVMDDQDKCPNTPKDEAADAEGCSPSQKFSCGDAISDGWRIRYFGSVLCDGEGAEKADPDNDGLTNLEEYQYSTDPKNRDTDYDGWTDKEEIDAGTNPLDPNSHPPSKLRILLWLLLILFILAVLGVGGWLGYQYYLEKQLEKIPPSIPARGLPAAKPARKMRKWPSIIEQLRKIARKDEQGVNDRDWVSLGELADRVKKEKVPMREDVFVRLNALLSGKIPKKEAESVLAEIRKQPEAFRLLRRISFEKLSPADKELVRKRLAFLKEGNLTSAELEEILTKLRITAAYYKNHREELERELEEWLKEGKRRKK